MRLKNVLGWISVVALFAALVLGVKNFQSLYDWWQLRDYNPDARIVKLADETTMNPSTRRVFYVNHPQLDDKQEFNKHCQSPEKTIVLGCFIDKQGIYLLNVTDSRLEGVDEVTAAHETLHAMYARLSKKERARVDAMTESFFKGLDNERIRKTIESYRSRDPSVVPNELHSILGTEVRHLSPELEDYYRQYFSDREKIVSYSEHYEQAFVDLEDKAKSYDQELSVLRQKINTDEEALQAKSREIDDRQQELNDMLAQGKTDEYNNTVPGYNRLVDEYNVMVNQAKQEINNYNELIVERNNLVIQQQQLYQVIDSRSINEKSSK
ncbi:MAG TPA: hypothetical protein VFW77_04710 [Candidatus Saccharimonadales bacterium]|nr:hypothetical protein [Candidatus Saccharimonadales bacterium]